MRSERERLEKQLQDCSAALERLEGAVRSGLDSIERVRDKMDRLRHEIQRLEQEARQNESKKGEDRLMQEYQLLAADRRRTDNATDLLTKERLENQRLMDSLEAETRRREEQKLTKLQEKKRERGRSPVQKEHHQQAAPFIVNASPTRKPFINIQPPAMETRAEQTARREHGRQRLDEENKQQERERKERKERDREREDQAKRRRERENLERKQRDRERENYERRRPNALRNSLARKSVPDLRALPEGVRHVTPSTAEQAIQEDRQKNHGKVMDTVRNVLSPLCLMKSPGTRDRSPTPSLRTQEEREREVRKKAVKEVAKEEKTMFPADLLPPARAEAVNTRSEAQTPAGSPRIPHQAPAEAGPTVLPVKKSKTGPKREIRFNVPLGGKPESIAESSNTAPTAKKLQKRSIEDLRKQVNRTEDDGKKMNDAHFVAMRLASEVRKYEPEERKDCSEMPKLRPLETKYGQVKE
jgi:hypothetical protein